MSLPHTGLTRQCSALPSAAGRRKNAVPHILFGRHTMEPNSTPSGLGQPVRPLIRVLAALIGLLGFVGLVLHAVLIYFDAPGYRLELKTASELFLFALFAAYGICIGLRGKAPKGLLPWK